jgi:hypothetical protein
LFLPSTFLPLPLHSCCRVVCVRWWMRVTCASHRVGDGFSLFLFLFRFVWLRASFHALWQSTYYMATWHAKPTARLKRETEGQRKGEIE